MHVYTQSDIQLYTKLLNTHTHTHCVHVQDQLVGRGHHHQPPILHLHHLLPIYRQIHHLCLRWHPLCVCVCVCVCISTCINNKVHTVITMHTYSILHCTFINDQLIFSPSFRLLILSLKASHSSNRWSLANHTFKEPLGDCKKRPVGLCLHDGRWGGHQLGIGMNLWELRTEREKYECTCYKCNWNASFVHVYVWYSHLVLRVPRPFLCMYNACLKHCGTYSVYSSTHMKVLLRLIYDNDTNN